MENMFKVTRSILMLASAAAVVACAAETKLGKALTLTESVPVARMLEISASQVGKTVQVKGKVTEVCEAMGCWMALADAQDGAKIIRIKVNDGEIVFPKEAVGKLAVAEGTLAKIELTREEAIAQAKHEAEESGRKFDAKKVKGPVTMYQIRGSGAVVMD